MKNFKHLAFVLLSVSHTSRILRFRWKLLATANPMMDPSMAPMGPPMQGPPMGMPMDAMPMGPPMGGPGMPLCQPMQPPSFCGPVMPCQPRQNFLGPLTLSAGYVDTFKNSQIRREVSSNPPTITPSYEFKVPTTGAWFGASQTFHVGPKCGLVGSGGYWRLPRPTYCGPARNPRRYRPLSDTDIDNQWVESTRSFLRGFSHSELQFRISHLGWIRWDYFEQKVTATLWTLMG